MPIGTSSARKLPNYPDRDVPGPWKVGGLSPAMLQAVWSDTQMPAGPQHVFTWQTKPAAQGDARLHGARPAHDTPMPQNPCPFAREKQTQFGLFWHGMNVTHVAPTHVALICADAGVSDARIMGATYAAALTCSVRFMSSRRFNAFTSNPFKSSFGGMSPPWLTDVRDQ
jgi:hypothetical protein